MILGIFWSAGSVLDGIWRRIGSYVGVVFEGILKVAKIGEKIVFKGIVERGFRGDCPKIF